MHELKRTQARAAFKDLLGQANHFLITILVGLNGVRSGKIEHDAEFHAAWNPKDVRSSADRSRVFALDLALVRAVDALDTYMMMCRRAPSALGSAKFEAEMDGAGQSVASRLNVFFNHTQSVPAEYAALMRLAVAWRNRKVHSLADNALAQTDRETLMSSGEQLRTAFRGLAVVETLERFEVSGSPHFKDAASIIALAHKLVELFDQHLLANMDVEEYVRISLRNSLAVSAVRSEADQLKHAARKIWGDRQGRAVKAARALRFIGVHPVEVVTARVVPDELIGNILRFEPEEAVEFLAPARINALR